MTTALQTLDDWVNGHSTNGKASLNRPITVRRSSSLGDCLAATYIAKELLSRGHSVQFQAIPAMHPLLKRVDLGSQFAVTDVPKNTFPDVNLDGAYETDPLRAERHFADMFLESANRQLAKLGIQIGWRDRNGVRTRAINFAPKIKSEPVLHARLKAQLDGLNLPRPWTMICPKSWSWANRTVPTDIWAKAAPQIPGTKFWLSNDAAPKGVVDLKCKTVESLVEFIALADLLLSVDSGPIHISAALGVPVIAIKQQSDPALHLSAQKDFKVLDAGDGLDCLGCNFEYCPIDKEIPPCQEIRPDIIAAAAKARLTTKTSAVIAVYKPKPENLSRCLACILPQVDEVVICGDWDTDMAAVEALSFSASSSASASPVPIHLVQLPVRNSGYGRKATRAARESNGQFLLFLNDDVFLDPDVVAKLMEHMQDETVGAVTHTLRYPDGTLQFAGLGRPAGHVGFGHLDHRKTVGRFTEPVEQESMCAASVLIRRKAFFEAGCFSERFFCYSEDASCGLAIRRAGYKIIFEPAASGIHIEHESTGLMGDISPVLEESHRIFAQEWVEYFRANEDPSRLGTFDYLKKEDK